MIPDHKTKFIVELGTELNAHWPLDSSGRWEIHESLSERLKEVFADLGLPTDCFELLIVNREDTENKVPFRLFINGKYCRGLFPHYNLPFKVEKFVDAVFEIFFGNRAHLISEDFTEAAWQYSLPEFKPSTCPISTDEFSRFLVLLVEHGHHLDNPLSKLKSILRHGVKNSSLEEQIQAIISLSAHSDIVVNVAPELLTQKYFEKATLDAIGNEIENRLFSELGLLLPSPSFRGDERLKKNEFRVRVNNLKWPISRLDLSDPVNSAIRVLRPNAHLFLTSSTVDIMLGRLREAFPMPVFNCIEVFGTIRIAQVLNKLLEEGISIRDLRTILGAMLEVNGTMSIDLEEFEVFSPYETNLIPRKREHSDPISVSEYADYIRLQLKHQICQMYASYENMLFTHRISKGIQERLMEADDLPLNDEEQNLLCYSILQKLNGPGEHPILLTSFYTRRCLRDIICRDFPELPVLCKQEISEFVEMVSLGEIDCIFPSRPETRSFVPF